MYVWHIHCYQGTNFLCIFLSLKDTSPFFTCAFTCTHRGVVRLLSSSRSLKAVYMKCCMRSISLWFREKYVWEVFPCGSGKNKIRKRGIHPSKYSERLKCLKMLTIAFLLSSKHEKIKGKFPRFSRNQGIRSQTLNMFVRGIYRAYENVGFLKLSQNERHCREQNAPHKSFRQLMHKIKYLVPVLRYAPRPGKKTRSLWVVGLSYGKGGEERGISSETQPPRTVWSPQDPPGGSRERFWGCFPVRQRAAAEPGRRKLPRHKPHRRQLRRGRGGSCPKNGRRRHFFFTQKAPFYLTKTIIIIK